MIAPTYLPLEIPNPVEIAAARARGPEPMGVRVIMVVFSIFLRRHR